MSNTWGWFWNGQPRHDGTAFVEVYQNCNVFNDGAWLYAKDRTVKADNVIELEHGKPLIFGKNRDKGIRLNGMEPEVVELGKGITEDDLLFHDEKSPEPSLAYLLSRMRYEDGFPEPIGVFRSVDHPRYDVLLNDQVEQAFATRVKATSTSYFTPVRHGVSNDRLPRLRLRKYRRGGPL